MTTPEGYSGVDFLLEVENPDVPGTYVEIGALRTNSFQLNNEQFDVTSKDGSRWQKLITGGIQKLSASGAGVSKRSVALAYLHALMMANDEANFKFSSAMGDEFACSCFVKTMQRQGGHTGPEDYSISLESNGTVTYTAPDPEVTSVAPTAGAGTLSPVGGTPITILGTGFQFGMGITLGGVACTSVVIVDEGHATAVSPAHAAGVVACVVTNDDGTTDTLASAATYNPDVVSVAPTAGPGTLATAGGTAITITGTGFATGATVLLGGNPCTSVVVVSGTSITAVAPAHAAGAVTCLVTNTDGGYDSLAAAATYA